MVEVAAGPSDSSTHEKVSYIYKVPQLPLSSQETLMSVFLAASHGAQSAQIKLLSPGSL